VSMGEIQVREALAGEYEDLGRLIQRAYAEYARPGDPLWDGYFSMLADVIGRAAFATVLVAVTGGQVIGTATMELDKTIEGTQDLQPGQANFRFLAVDPPARGHGAGRRLVQACIQFARTAGKEVATLHTTDQMTAAQQIYRSLCFERDPPRDIELSPDLVLRAFRLPLRPPD
jgi:GNAT superfamily N-acetyltransferase